jgi:hypothetical protein
LVASLQQLGESSVLEVHGYGVDQKNLVGKHFATFRVASRLAMISSRRIVDASIALCVAASRVSASWARRCSSFVNSRSIEATSVEVIAATRLSTVFLILMALNPY